jgi:hypothetical protein
VITGKIVICCSPAPTAADEMVQQSRDLTQDHHRFGWNGLVSSGDEIFLKDDVA